MGRMKRAAFTLIELLVVVAIVGLLAGILVPSLSKARGQTRRIVCAAHLRQVGVAMMSYLQESRDRMPYISYMPSVDPAPLTTEEPIYLADVLEKHFKGQTDVLQCPDDKPGATDRAAPNTGLSFFQSERSSYEYRVHLAGLKSTEIGRNGGRPWPPPGGQDDSVSPNTVWFARDYDNFHGKAGQTGARRYVYIDGHVSDYEN